MFCLSVRGGPLHLRHREDGTSESNESLPRFAVQRLFKKSIRHLEGISIRMPDHAKTPLYQVRTAQTAVAIVLILTGVPHGTMRLGGETPNPQAAMVIVKPASSLDIYGGELVAHDQNEATGLFHLKKIRDRWLFYTALGNPFWELAVDNARLGSDLGVDINGHGNAFWVAQKYALGRGPADGFSESRARWAYYVRQMARSWGFTGIGAYSYPPIVPDIVAGTDPPMGRMPSNKMTYVITHQNSIAAMDAGAKNLFASVFARVGSGPYFADPYDPKFKSSVHAMARSLTGHAKDPWVRYVFTGQADQLRGMLGTHPHLGLVVAASSPSVPADSNGWRGPKSYKDTTNYAKYALRDYLEIIYPSVAQLNAAWGTQYTTFDSAGGWGTGSGFLDEDGRGLCSGWYRPGPDFPCPSVSIRQDLDAFATQLVRRYYEIIHTEYRAVTNYLLESTDIGPQTWGYALAGMRDADGRPLVDLISMVAYGLSSEPALEDEIYRETGIPMVLHGQVMANNDSPLAMAGTVDKVTDLGNTRECGVPDQGIQITCNSCNFWWWNGATNGSVYIPPYPNNSLLKFSTIPYYKPDGGTKYEYYFPTFS